MKKFLLLSSFGVALAFTAAFAGDAFLADCEEFKSANGVDGDCPCMADAVSDNEALAKEIMAMETVDEIDGLSDEAKAVIGKCSKE